MEHQLEGVHAELSDLPGVQATDEPAQCYHLYSSQLLRCQVVIFSNTLPQRLHLFRQAIWISEHHHHQDNGHMHMALFLLPVTHSSHTGQYPLERPVRGGASPGRCWRSPELNTPAASPRSQSCLRLDPRPADTHRNEQSFKFFSHQTYLLFLICRLCPVHELL